MSKVAMWKVFGAFVGLSVVIFVWVGIAVTAEWHPMVLAAGCALVTLTVGSLIAIIAIDGAKRCCQRQVKKLKIDHEAELKQSRIDFVHLLPAFQCIADGYPWSTDENARFLVARWLVRQFENGGNTVEWVEALRDGNVIPLTKIMDHMDPAVRYSEETDLRVKVMGAISSMLQPLASTPAQDSSREEPVAKDAIEANAA